MSAEGTADNPLAVRFRFWRDGFWRVGLTNVFTSLAVLGLVGDHVYTAYHPPEPLYFYTDSYGNLIEGTGLDQRVMSDADLMDFTARAILAVYNFDYVHYRATLSREATPNFTVNGWNGVVAAVEKTKNLDEVKANAMVVSATALASPVIRQSGQIGDHLVWSIQLPIHVSYANWKETRGGDLLVTATVIRVPTTSYPKGVAIDSFVANPPS